MPFGVLSEKVYLNVPFEEKEDAKRLGAKFDWDIKKWYIWNSNPKLNECQEQWKLNTDPVILTGEDRSYGGNELFIDLIPTTCWFKNVRYYVDSSDWDRLRNHIYNRVNNVCEICNADTTKPVIPFNNNKNVVLKNKPVKIKNREGQLVEGKIEDVLSKDEYFIRFKDDKGNEDADFYKKDDIIFEDIKIEPKIVSLEAHERWHYDYNTNTQKLVRLVGLCKKCHTVTHMGRAQMVNIDDDAIEHLKKIRNFTDNEVKEHQRHASELFNERSKIKWNLDLSLLTNNNIKIKQLSCNKELFNDK